MKNGHRSSSVSNIIQFTKLNEQILQKRVLKINFKLQTFHKKIKFDCKVYLPFSDNDGGGAVDSIIK